MAHWAKVDENNIVVEVIVTDNNDPNGDEGYQWLIDNLGGRWIQTSYNNNFRKRYAGIGFIYDEENDVFLFPKPFESWILNSEFEWQPPIAKPREDRFYIWDEESISWKVPPSPFPSWQLENDMWIPPVPYPNDGKTYDWDEGTKSWFEIEFATPNE